MISSQSSEPATGEGGCGLVVAGGATLALANLLVAAAIVGGGGGYAVAIYLPLLWIVAAFLLLPAFGLGLLRRVAAGDLPAVAVGLLAAGGTVVLVAHASEELHIPALDSEWILTLVTGAGTLAAAIVVEPKFRRPAALAVLAVVASASLVSLPLATNLHVTIVSAPEVVGSGGSERLLFEASEAGRYEIWLGVACGRGEQVASGLYGPADSPTGEVLLSANGRDAVDRIHVCVRNGIASGSDTAEIRVDGVPPTAATLDVQPTIGQGMDRTAETRTLELRGTAPDQARLVLEIYDAGGRVPIDVPVHDGAWQVRRTFSPVVDEFSVGVVTEDAAGLTTRAPMLHVRFVGLDPSPVALDDLPGLRVECRGEPKLAPDACRAWARDTLELRPDLLEDAVRLLLAQPNVYDSCFAETRSAEGFVETGTVIGCPDDGA